MFKRIFKIFIDLIFPLLPGAVYLTQVHVPAVFKLGALWSDHPRWWQFFTNGFLSGNWIHLLFNMAGLWVVCSWAASRIRLYFLFIYFVFFSAVSSFLYFRFFMPPHATLTGASGGVYALIGFLCWFQRRDRVCFLGIRKLAMSFLPAMLILLLIEFLVAAFWIPVLAWPVHMIAFSVSISSAAVVYAVYAGLNRLAGCDRLAFRKLFGQSALILQKAGRGMINIPLAADQ